MGRLGVIAVAVGASLLAAWSAAVVVFFLPLRLGPVPVPVSVLVAAGVLFLVPRGCYALTSSLVASAAPVVVWAAVTLGLVFYRNPLYRQLPLGVWDWRLLLLLGVAGLTATVALSSLRSPVRRDRGSDAKAGKGY